MLIGKELSQLYNTVNNTINNKVVTKPKKNVNIKNVN